MDLNARISWAPGMELTAQTLIGLERQFDLRQQIALRAALGSSQMGLLPGAEFLSSGSFVGSTYEIPHLKCLCVLPSGSIMHIDEPVAVPIPMLYGDRYYLTAAIGEGTTEFEREGVGYQRPNYVYAIQTLEDAERSDVMPLVRFVVQGGIFSVDSNFIPPCLMLADDARFLDYLTRFSKAVETLAVHANLEEGDGKRTLYRYLFLLKGFNRQQRVYDLVQLTQEIVQAVDYFIVRPNEAQPVDIPQPSSVDVGLWLEWVDSYLAGAATILDKVVLVDNTIDYEALLAQAKRELYEQLHPELLEKLIRQTKEELQDEMQKLNENISLYVRNTLREELAEQLATDIESRAALIDSHVTESMKLMEESLTKSLYDKLFSEVYLGVYNVLHEEREEVFVPLI